MLITIIIFYITAITSTCFVTPHTFSGGTTITSSALDREGGMQTMAAGGYEIIGATADLQQPCWMVLTVYRRA